MPRHNSNDQAHSGYRFRPPPSHTLPPLPVSGYNAPSGDHAYPSRNSSQSMTSQPDTITQSASFPPYAPTARTYYQHHYDSTGLATMAFQPQQVQPSILSSMPIQSQSPVQPAYAAHSRSLPEIAPMPPRVDGNQVSGFGNGGEITEQEEKPQRPHVVGAQGRRGILPSSAGRPPAVVGDNIAGQKAAATPAKNADGKFPCEHCEKTYLHAKHLKRHLLRHTGVRPYACGLCNDTFSRSDILKRHFHKCSERRGNPTGENHLAHSRAHKKVKEQEVDQPGVTTPTVTDHAHMSNYATTNIEPTFDFNNLSLAQSSYGDSSNQVSRANSVKGSKRSNGTQSNRASLGMVNTSGYESTGYSHSTGHMTPDSVTTSGVATPYTSHHDSRTSQIPDSGAFTHITNGNSTYGATSMPPTSSNYNQTSLPHIVGQDSGRENGGIGWPPFHPYQSYDEYGNGQHHSGSNTPPDALDRDKANPDFSNLPYNFYANQPKN